jgi:hypothetical protein
MKLRNRDYSSSWQPNGTLTRWISPAMGEIFCIQTEAAPTSYSSSPGSSPILPSPACGGG